MLSYEVTIRLEDPSLAESLVAYMRDRHVGEVVAAGRFLDGRFEQSAPDLFRSRYTVASQEDLDRYIQEHAPRLRDDFARHFPSGLSLSRAVWSEVVGIRGASDSPSL